MKKALIIVLCLLYAFTTAACGANNATTATTAGAAATTAAAVTAAATTAVATTAATTVAASAAAATTAATAAATTAATAAATTAATAAATTAAAASPERDFIKIDVYNQYANFQGIAGGWFAKILKDKYNIEANIISPNVAGGDTIYQTRSASGSLGDIVLLDNENSKIADSIRVGLFLDISKNGLYDTYGGNLKNYRGAIERYQRIYNTGNAIYGIPMQVSNQKPTVPQDGKYLNNASYIRWDLYRQIGSPKIGNFDELLDVLKQMQEANPQNDLGKRVYGISLFKDWDGVLMNNPANLSYMNGEEIIGGFAIIQYENNYNITDVLSRDAWYIKGLEFFNKAESMGLMDPDSPSHNFETLRDKVQTGQILFVFWPWLGSSFDNVNENKQNGRGFAPVPVQSQKLIATGSTPNGQFRNVQVGSKTKWPERMVELVDWFYSVEYNELVNAGIEGLHWKIVDGAPQRTDFLDKLGDETVIPDEYGGGIQKDGGTQFTNMFLSGTSINPRTNEPFNPDLWKHTLKYRNFQLDLDWQADNGALTQKEYVIANNLITVVPGTDYQDPTPSSDLQSKINQISTIIKDNSWKMIFAANKAEFESLYSDMLNKVTALGFNEAYDFYKAAAEQKISLVKEAKAK